LSKFLKTLEIQSRSIIPHSEFQMLGMPSGFDLKARFTTAKAALNSKGQVNQTRPAP
jgi:hypothetical protein